MAYNLMNRIHAQKIMLTRVNSCPCCCPKKELKKLEANIDNIPKGLCPNANPDMAPKFTAETVVAIFLAPTGPSRRWVRSYCAPHDVTK